MGFRSTITTEDLGYKIPKWFVEKYPYLSFGITIDNIDNVDKEFPSFPISSKCETKFYDKVSEQEVFTDIQKILKEQDIEELIVVLLHECGGITRVKITKNTITAREPIEWKEVDVVEHNYCYGCSDSPVN